MIISVAEWLQRFRRGRQFSQKEFAERLGYSSETVRKFENRGSRPSSGFSTSLAANLGLTRERSDELIVFLRGAPVDEPQRVPEWIAELAEPARASRAPTNLPDPLTRLVGRAEALAQLSALLASPEVRLLTLVGPAGVGKTRLGLAVAEHMRDVVQDGVYLIELATVREADDIERAIADGLRLRDVAGRTSVESLTDYLRGKRMLLVLDNFEQFANERQVERQGIAGQVVAGLLRSARQLKILATSRVRLHVTGERLYQVQPFRVPQALSRDAYEAIAQEPAIQLFVDRVRDATPEFTLDTRNVDAVLEICRQVDGIPLAIELAAARCDQLEVAGVAKHLVQQGRLNVLVDGPVDMEARHRTLRGAIEWSFSLLDPRSQDLFARLGVFVGGFTLSAATAVLGSETARSPASERTVKARLSALVDASLMRQSRPNTSRYTTLETLREFAVERLNTSNQWTAAADAHAAFYVGLAEQIEPELVGADQAHSLDICEAEHANIRAALSWLLDHEQIEDAARLAGALWRFWWTRGYLTDGRAWCDVVLRERTALSPLNCARILTADGILARSQRALERADALLTEALAIWRQLERWDGGTLALSNLGSIAESLMQYDLARERFGQCLEYYRLTGDARGQAHALNNLAVVAIDEGRFQDGSTLGRQSLALFERGATDERGKALAQRNLGWIATALTEYATAREWLDSSLALYRRLADREGVASVMNNLALISYLQSDYARASELAIEALRMFYELADFAGMAESIEILSACAGRLGNGSAAARGFGVADVLRKSVRTPHFPSQRETYRSMIAAARQDVDQVVWSAAWADGTARPDDTIAEMLGHA